MTDSNSAPMAVLFDIDGTLVDSNYLHIDAWDRAFVAAGHPVDLWRIHRSIGMDSGKLLERLLGDDIDAIGDEVKERHGDAYGMTTDRLRVIDGAKDIIEELSRRGHRVVLATSAPQSELDVLLGLLGVDRDIAAVTSSEDVGTAKPDPDIVHVALDRAGAAPDTAVLIGDSVWDVEAAQRAGVASIGVLSGGFSREELLAAGATAVYDDVADLLAHLDESPIRR